MCPVSWGQGVTKDVALLELTTADGISGLGSAYTGSRQVLEAWKTYRRNPETLHKAQDEMAIPMSAIDIALWDIKGKKTGKSISELLGGRQRDCILAYATVSLPLTTARPGDAFEQGVRSVMNLGFKAIKLSMAGFGHRNSTRSDLEWDSYEAALLTFAREIVGPEFTLMLDVYGSDPNWSGSFDWALKTARILEKLGYLWLEEPLPPTATEEYIRLSLASGIAISGGEDFIALKDFESWSAKRAVSILQPDCTRVGGLTPLHCIREAAHHHNIDLIPHGWNTAVGLAADLQFQATTPEGRLCMVEYMPARHLEEPLKHDPFGLDHEGMIAVPTGPGLGVELDNDRVEDGVGVFDCGEETIELPW
jgi:L-alanine-DL-glutamate epimerase-like enolase superfamily enzyme